MRFDRESWRKLYRAEPLEQRVWPLVTRAVRDHLVRYPEDLDGHLMTLDVPPDQAGDMVGDMLCQALGTHPDERDLVRRAIETLLRDRYLIIEGTGRGTSGGQGGGQSVVRIRNYESAQLSSEELKRVKAAKKKARQRSTGSSAAAEPEGDIKGTGRGTSGGQGGGTSRAHAIPDETPPDETREENPGGQSSSFDGDKTGDIARFEASFNGRCAGPGEDPQVLQLFEAYKASLGKPHAKFKGANDHRARILLDAINVHGLADCLTVAGSAPRDGMVNGKDDDRRKKHDTIEYIFDNPNTFERILGAAIGIEEKSQTRLSPGEALRKAKAQ